MPAFLETGSGLPVSLSALIVDLDIDVEGLHPAKWIPGLDVQAISAVRDRIARIIAPRPFKINGSILGPVVILKHQIAQLLTPTLAGRLRTDPDQDRRVG